jgi:protein phosphatase
VPALSRREPGLVIEIPVPSLVVLIGAAGAGKSTLAQRLFQPDEIVSSDEMRALLTGDPANQQVTRRAFGILHREVARRLLDRRLVVVDATSVERHARSSLRRLARAAGVPTVALALAMPPAQVHARNAARRGRVVPAEVVDQHLRLVGRLGTSPLQVAAALAVEGFDAVHVLWTTGELDDAVVMRRPLVPRPR